MFANFPQAQNLVVFVSDLLLQRAKPFICVKQPAPARDEVIGDFVKFAQSNQPVADKPASGVFLGFMATRFPCANK